jgi:Dolichyl-phosphate-mannose-protein mannosyltransferase
MTGSSSLAGSPSWLAPDRLIGVVGMVTLTVLAVLYIVLDNDSFFNFWTDRDMVRSEMLLTEFQWMGAELSYGSAARVPGGALHYFWFLPTLLSKDPKLSYQFCVLLGMLSLVPFYWAMQRSFGDAAAVASTMVLLASPILFGTLTRLWNPSFQAPFIILTFAFLVRLLAEQHVPSFKWMVASLVLGMQMHLSTYLLVVCVIVALVVTRTRIPLKEALYAFLLALFLLGPYLVGEYLSGWDNIRQMVGSQGRGAVRSASLTRGVMYNPDNVGDVWRWYMLSGRMNDDLPAAPLQTARSWLLNLSIVLGGAYTALAIIHWLGWGRPITKLLNVPVDGGYGRVLVASMIPVLLGFLYFSYSPQVELVIYGSARYLMFAIPGLAIIAGLGVGALFAVARGNRVAQAAVALPIVVAVGMPAYALATSLRALDKPWNTPGRDFMGSLDQVAREMNWDLTNTVARSSVLRRHDASDDRWRFENIFGIGYELHRTSTPVPFSQTGECAAYLTDGGSIYGDKGISLEALERSFEQPGLKLEIVRQKRLTSDLLVIFKRLDGRGFCFTTVSNRYVLSDEERATLDRYGTIPEATAAPTRATMGDRERGYIMNLGQGIYGLLKLSHRNGKLEIEFHSNQLRGDTYNGGFLDIGMIANPRLVFTSTVRDPVTIQIETGLVGGKGTFTPLDLAEPLAPGVYDVTFQAEVYPPVKLGTWPVDFTAKKPVSVSLGTRQTFGN